MAANVTFNINAIDGTRKAFASVNQGLRNLIKGGDSTQKKLLLMGLRATGLGTILAVLAKSVTKVASETEKVPGISQDTIDSWDRLKSAASTTGGVVQNMVASAGAGISDLVSIIRFGAIGAFKGLDAAEKDLLETDALAAADRRDRSGDIDKEIISLLKLGEAQKKLRLIRETPGASIARLREEATMLENQATNTKDVTKKTGLLTQATELRTEAEKNLITIQKDYNDSQKIRTDGEDKISRVFQSSTKSLKELNAEYWKTRRMAETSNLNMLGGDPSAIERSTTLNKKLIDIDKERLDIMKRQRDIADDVGASIAGGFEEAIISGGNLRDVLKGVLQDIIRIIIRQTITTPIASAISGGISGMFGGGKAVGGPVSNGTSYLVGEKGPEIFTPSQAGRIIPNHNIQPIGGGSGDSYNFVYNISSGVTKSELIPYLKQTQESTIARIQSMRVRSSRSMAAA